MVEPSVHHEAEELLEVLKKNVSFLLIGSVAEFVRTLSQELLAFLDGLDCFVHLLEILVNGQHVIDRFVSFCIFYFYVVFISVILLIKYLEAKYSLDLLFDARIQGRGIHQVSIVILFIW